MAIVGKTTVNNFSKLFTESKITFAGNYYQNKENTYFYLKKQLEETVGELSKKALKSPKVIFNFFEKAYIKSVDLNKFSEKYSNKNLSGIPTKELLYFYNQILDAFEEMYAYGTVPILVGYSQDNPIYEKANKILAKKTKKNTDKAANFMITLTNPPRTLVTNYKEIEMLQIAKQAKKRELKNEKEIICNFRNKIDKIFQKYGWLSYDFRDELTQTIDDYAKNIFEKINTDIDARLKFLTDYEKIVKTEFEKTIKELKLNKKEIDTFSIIREMGFYKWAREYEFTRALYNFKFIQDELGRRANLSSMEVKFLLPGEMKGALNNNEKYKNIVNDRQKNCLILCGIKNNIDIFSGQVAKQKFDRMEFESTGKKFGKQGDIKGTSAYNGKARGIVKIVSVVGHIGKMGEGDILVSVATTPDLLLAMKKAAAIITDEGGITCHAAIVSRELEIPCIVGTKIATKILKDGDLVEVDADKGVVRILKKNGK